VAAQTLITAGVNVSGTDRMIGTRSGTRKEAHLRSTRLFNKALQRYWRLTRGLTLGAQAIVIDAEDRILLVKHTYRPSWCFPGGGVERHEPAEAALARELNEEAGVMLTGKPELFGLYANFRAFPSDHVAFYIVRHWKQPRPPGPTREIAAHGLFAMDALPRDVNQSVVRRIGEIFEGEPKSAMW
jgi:8-oxo-dGTP pyrophosphatase MutT (NUDIX family)